MAGHQVASSSRDKKKYSYLKIGFGQQKYCAVVYAACGYTEDNKVGVCFVAAKHNPPHSCSAIAMLTNVLCKRENSFVIDLTHQQH